VFRRKRSGLPSKSKSDGADLQLRVGLNSGQVIAGEIGSGALGYTASVSKSAWHSGWNRRHRRVG